MTPALRAPAFAVCVFSAKAALAMLAGAQDFQCAPPAFDLCAPPPRPRPTCLLGGRGSGVALVCGSNWLSRVRAMPEWLNSDTCDFKRRNLTVWFCLFIPCHLLRFVVESNCVLRGLPYRPHGSRCAVGSVGGRSPPRGKGKGEGWGGWPPNLRLGASLLSSRLP